MRLALALPLTLAFCTRDPRPFTPPAAATATTTTTATPTATSHHDVRFSDLPSPFASPDVDNPPRVVDRPPGADLRLPPGFRIEPFAEGGFEQPRWLALAPGGDVFLADSRAGRIFVLRGAERFLFAAGLKQPFGIAFAPGYVYVGDTDAVVRFPYAPGDTSARAAPEAIAPLPGRGYHEHWTRNLLFSRDFAKLYVTIGSTTNDQLEDDPERASILEMSPDGSHRRVFASGTRNPIGLAWRPGTSELWAAVQERDRLGDDLVPDYVTRVEEGAFYGWPFAYVGPHEDPNNRGQRSDLVARTRTPDLLLQAHSAVIALLFYEGASFPPDWRGDAIVSLHGSWNRSQRTGYSLVRVHMKEGRPAGGYDDFVTGWMLAPDGKEVWGRPAGMVVLPDGSLLVADDGARLVWRVTYAKG